MTEFWVVRDRRHTEAEVCAAVVEGRINSIYWTEPAAKAAAYPTEKVWKITVAAMEAK